MAKKSIISVGRMLPVLALGVFGACDSKSSAESDAAPSDAKVATKAAPAVAKNASKKKAKTDAKQTAAKKDPDEDDEDDEDEADEAATPATTGAGKTAGEIEFPAIPMIVIPEVIGVGDAQRALESSMQSVIDPIGGVSVKPARCGADGSLLADGGMTSADSEGSMSRVGAKGIFALKKDGSGEALVEGATIKVNADGSGSIIRDGGDDTEKGSVVEVNADGSGSYNGPYGLIELDGKGGGSWNNDDGLIEVEADGSGKWNGPLGNVEINADGSGSWVGGPLEMVENNGDGTGTVGATGDPIKMAPLPKVAPAGKFPPLNKFSLPGAPCGYVISLSDSVLFDFGKAELRPEASKVLDSLGAALKSVTAKAIVVGGHTDSKGSDKYNQALSEQRAQSVIKALQGRGAASGATAKGYGETQPVAPNEIGGRDNPSGRQLNRRVEVFVQT